MIKMSEKIHFISVVNGENSLVDFPKPFCNTILSLDRIEKESLNDVDLVHGIFYFTENNTTEGDEEFLSLTRLYSRVPIIHVGNTITDLTPRVKLGKPFFSINRNDLTKKEIVSVLMSMPQFKSMLAVQGALMEDVDSTRLIADLNIERLHKTLKDLEKEKRKTEKINRSKQLFLAGITHELRTPLTAIHGFADLFNLENLSAEQKNNISIIKEASANLLNIVNDLLNYSKLAEGKLSIYKESFGLFATVKSVCDLLIPEIKEKNLNFEFEFLVDKEIQVLGDRFRLKQVLTNLLSNAIKFTDKGGVSLTVSQSVGNNLIFTIKDSGVGIKEEKLNDIFESYVQAEDSTSHEYGGTGLGLAIVKELIQLQGGEITVKSQVNEGSEFSFQLSLPTVQNDDSSEDIQDATQLDLSSINVLVVEDNHLNQMLIQKMLGSKVKSLKIAGDGVSAIEKAREDKFDVILMDLHLPKMSGMEVVAEIRKSSANITTPIAVITANVWEEQLDMIKQNGIATIIQKPFNRKDLFFQIYTLCNERNGDLIHLDYLKQVSGGDHYFIVEVLVTYQNNIPSDMVKLTNAVQEGDVESSKTLAHKMKSSFRMLQIEEACEICEEIESSQETSNPVNLAKSLKKIIDKSLFEAQELILKYSD